MESALGDGGQSMKPDVVAGQANWLHDNVAERPRAGSNTIIVTQMPNIQAAFTLLRDRRSRPWDNL